MNIFQNLNKKVKKKKKKTKKIKKVKDASKAAPLLALSILKPNCTL